ncbi:MAG: bicyclomycin resistance protein [Betaproteobacteria bacterium]|nr:bicyclomycin resistance protein [Betaproteobacteria bacterium]MCC7215971.1 bicyclomycin resistance protein [Burkholderiales bacterium]
MILLRAAVIACAALACAPAVAADPAKVLRLPSSDVDTLDPHQLQDTYSRDVASVIFEGLYEWSYLDRPPVPVPRTAAAMPEVSPDGRTWTIRIKPGIRFTPDPAFGGTPRELVAADYVYSIKRTLDPNLRGGGEPLTTDLIVGMRGVVDAARRPGARFDYDALVEGLRAVDRYTLQLRLREANFPVATNVLQTQAVAREVVEAARGDIQSRAVGTGPYRLADWQRGSRIVLDANPDYRTLAFPDSRDPARAALVESMRGRSLPAIGRIELVVIDEQPVRVLEFDRGTLDVIALRGEAVAPLLPNGELAPALAARGVGRIAYATNSVRSIYVNMDDPVVGGTSRERVALRRAIALGIDVESLIRVVYAGQGLPANQVVPPGIAGFDTAAPPRAFDPRLASALLDRFGYGKRDARGYRLAPDGKPLTLKMTIFTAAVWREIQTLLHKNMEAIGLRIEFRPTPVQDLFKEAAQGRFMLNIHGRSASPDGLLFLTFYGPSPAEANESRFRSAEYDRAFEAFLRARDDAERTRAARTMNEVLRVYVPAIPLLVDVQNAFTQPWLLGYYPSPFAAYFQYLDVDVARRQ